MPKYSVSVVEPSQLPAVHQFHQRMVAAGSGHVAARSFQQFADLVDERSLFAVWEDDCDVVACCYVLREGQTLEFGGLLVDTGRRGNGIGSGMTAFALAAGMAEHDPFTAGLRVIAHVHGQNTLPRSLLSRVGFVHTGSHSFQPHQVPLGLMTNAAGLVPADEFDLPGTDKLRLEFEKLRNSSLLVLVRVAHGR